MPFISKVVIDNHRHLLLRTRWEIQKWKSFWQIATSNHFILRKSIKIPENQFGILPFFAQKFKWLLGRTRLKMLFRTKIAVYKFEKVAFSQCWVSINNSKLSFSFLKRLLATKLATKKQNQAADGSLVGSKTLWDHDAKSFKTKFFAMYSGNLRYFIVKFKKVRNGMKISHSLDLRIS